MVVTWVSNEIEEQSSPVVPVTMRFVKKNEKSDSVNLHVNTGFQAYAKKQKSEAIKMGYTKDENGVPMVCVKFFISEQRGSVSAV